MTDPLHLYGLAGDVLDCVTAALNETVMLAPERRCVVPGRAVDEECCDRVPGGGQLTVSLIRDYPSVRFPAETLEVLLCGQGTSVLEVEVKILRCGSQVDQHGAPPSCEEQAADAQLTAIDAHAVTRGIICCFEAETFALGPQVWMDPDGGCIGTRTTVYLDAGSIACCP